MVVVQVPLQEQEEQVEVVVEAQVGILQGLLVLRILEVVAEVLAHQE